MAFARTDHLVALARGGSLPTAERDRIAQRLSELTGLLDTRVTAKRDTTRTGGLNDPAFGGGTHRIGTLMRAPAIVPGSAQSRRAHPDTTAAPSVLETYLRHDLQFKTLESYRSLNLDINPLWNFERAPGAFEALADAARVERD